MAMLMKNHRQQGSYSIFTKERHPQAYTSQHYQEHSHTSHEHHMQCHNLISSISWRAKHMREAHLYGIWYKCSLWYRDTNATWYVRQMKMHMNIVMPKVFNLNCWSILPTVVKSLLTWVLTSKISPTNPNDPIDQVDTHVWSTLGQGHGQTLRRP
jgi:hypothetical protein